jgi:hypothetical protein
VRGAPTDPVTYRAAGSTETRVFVPSRFPNSASSFAVVFDPSDHREMGDLGVSIAIDSGHRRLLHQNIQTYKICHRRRSFLDLRGQGDPDITTIREGAALILRSSGTATAIYHLSATFPVLSVFHPEPGRDYGLIASDLPMENHSRRTEMCITDNHGSGQTLDLKIPSTEPLMHRLARSLRPTERRLTTSTRNAISTAARILDRTAPPLSPSGTCSVRLETPPSTGN